MTRTKQTARKIPSGKLEEPPRPSKKRLLVSAVISGKEEGEENLAPRKVASKKAKRRITVAPPAPVSTPTPTKKKRASKKKKSASASTNDEPKVKRPGVVTGYIVFMKEQRNNIKEQNPDLDFAGIAKKVGEEWRGLSETEQLRYKNMAAEQQAAKTAVTAES